MAKVTFDLPDELLAALPGAPEEAEREIRLAAAMYWCSRGELSTSWAARLAGLTYADFLQEAARKQFELFPVNIEELAEELARPRPGGGNIELIKEELVRGRLRSG